MFSVKWDKKADGDFGGSGRKGTIQFGKGKQFVCKLQTWEFGSCACFGLSRFSDAWEFKFDDENVDPFFKYLCTLDVDWKPKEFYFLLSGSQVKNYRTRTLVKHPNVKLRDVFENKSHGPNKVYLFRYSASMDFKPVRKLKGMT